MNITVENICKRFGKNVVLDEVSLKIEDRETFAIIGMSGMGKSLILKNIIGLMKPDSGRIFIGDIEMTNKKEDELIRIRAQHFGMVFQYSALLNSLTVEENLALPVTYGTKKTLSDVKDIVYANLELVDMERTGKLYPAELSGGMQKRIAVARALIKNPEIILYDEPTSGLDPVHADEVHDLIKSLKIKFKRTAVVVTHDIERIAGIADRIAFLHEGKILKVGAPGQFLKSDNELIQHFFNVKRSAV